MIITEKYVSFETAKLLKKAGFMDSVVKFFASGYDEKGRDKDIAHTELKDYPRPTIHMAIEWLIEKFNVQISPYKTTLGWYFDIYNLKEVDVTGSKYLYNGDFPNKDKTLDTYSEACDAGIQYYLGTIWEQEHKFIEEMKESFPIDLLTEQEREVAKSITNKMAAVKYIYDIIGEGLKTAKIYYDLYIEE